MLAFDSVMLLHLTHEGGGMCWQMSHGVTHEPAVSHSGDRERGKVSQEGSATIALESSADRPYQAIPIRRTQEFCAGSSSHTHARITERERKREREREREIERERERVY